MVVFALAEAGNRTVGRFSSERVDRVQTFTKLLLCVRRLTRMEPWETMTRQQGAIYEHQPESARSRKVLPLQWRVVENRQNLQRREMSRNWSEHDGWNVNLAA